MLTQELLKSFAHYDPETGKLTRKKLTQDGWVDEELGFEERASGRSQIRYRAFEIFGRKYRTHRAAWLYMTGEWPAHIDHIDGNGLNNKWSNLRDVRHVDNCKNRKLNKNSITGILGVSWIVSRNHYKISINIDKKKVTLGYTKDFFEACCMRKSAENKNDYHPNHGRAA